MSTIRVQCIDQTLTLVNTPLIASGGIREDTVAFSFCPQWDGFYKTAVFWRDPRVAYSVVLDENNSCVVPHEVLTDAGVFFFGVFGVNADAVQRTSEVIRYTVALGPITEGTQPPDPTPEIYTQLLAAIAALGDNTGKADRVDGAKAGNFASLTENGNLQDSGKKAADFLAADRLGAAGGVASLGEDGKVPSGQLPAMDYVPTEQKGQAGGVASLGEDGKVPSGQLPEVEVGSGWVMLKKNFHSYNSTLSSGELSGIPEIQIPAGCVAEFELTVFGVSSVNGMGAMYLLDTSRNLLGRMSIPPAASASYPTTQRITCLIDPSRETYLAISPGYFSDASQTPVYYNRTIAADMEGTPPVVTVGFDITSGISCLGYMLRYRILEG